MTRLPFFHALQVLCRVGTLAVFLCATDAAAAPGADPARPNLTPAQQQKLTTLENASRAQADQLFSRLRQLRGRLGDLYGGYALDGAEARRLNGEMNRVQGQLLDLRLSEQQGLRAILSADQFAQLQASIKRHREDHDDHDDHPHDRDDHSRDHGASDSHPAPTQSTIRL